MGSALRDQNFANGCAAIHARLAFASIGAVADLKPAAAAFGVDVIGNRGASGGDRRAENLANRLMQPRRAGSAQLGCGSKRMDTGREERFIHIYIAQAGKE